ncbi:MAG: hypothetical protein II998_06435 [Clostridia bacterium]|nr:hypothetical protein [Clostridia bacterium]
MGNAYFMVVLGILLAKGVGFYRDMVFAEMFGTSNVGGDIYFQVFGLVNLIFTGVGVALSTLVIKNLNKAENNGKEREYASQFLVKCMIYLVAAMAVAALLAKPIVSLILPGLSGADFNLAVNMMYVMIPSMSFVIIGYIISGILQNEKAFFITSVMSLPFNVIIILAAKLFDLTPLAVGAITTVGWFLQIVMLLPSFYKKKYSFFMAKSERLRSKDKNPEIIWIFISNMMFQLCFYTDRAFVSSEEGMISTLNYASNLFVTVASVFVVAMSTVIFPSISKNYEEGNKEYVNDILQYIITVMCAIFLPFLLVSGLFGSDIIRLIYEDGSFTQESTRAVSSIFFIYSLGILGYVSQELFNKVLYLAGKYKYTVIGTIAVVIVNALSNYLIETFVPLNVGLSHVTLMAVSTSFWLTLYAVVISIGIKTVVGPYWKKGLILNVAKIFFAGVLAGLVYVVFEIAAPGLTHGTISFIIPIGMCAVVYIAGLYFSGVLRHLIRSQKKGHE